jgi:vitamin B12 transporter
VAPGEQRIDDKYDNVTGSVKLGLEISDHWDVGLVSRYTDTHLHFTGENYANFPATPDSVQSENKTQQYYTRATVRGVIFDGFLDQTIGLAYSNIKTYGISPGNPEGDSFGNRVKIDWQGNIRLSATHVLVLGAEHQKDALTAPLSASTTIDSGYAELQSGFGGDFFDTLSVRYDDNDHFGNKVTYRVAPVYVIEKTGTKLKASVGTGFKAPSLEQLFLSFPEFNFFANPNLKPESSVGYDVGFEQALLKDTLRVAVTYFHNDIKNLISNNADFTSYANVGRAKTDGIESFIAYRPIQPLMLRLNYTFTQATDDVLHQELLRRPKHEVSLNSNWQPTPRLSLNATVLYVGA